MQKGDAADSAESQELRNQRSWENPKNWKFYRCIYSAKEDTRILVPKKRIYLGWTLNFAHMESYLFLTALGAGVAVVGFASKKRSR